MQALGSAANLAPWYNDGTSICHACFVCGSEELLLVDSAAQARIFSLVTLQFRYSQVSSILDILLMVYIQTSHLGSTANSDRRLFVPRRILLTSLSRQREHFISNCVSLEHLWIDRRHLLRHSGPSCGAGANTDIFSQQELCSLGETRPFLSSMPLLCSGHYAQSDRIHVQRKRRQKCSWRKRQHFNAQLFDRLPC